MLALTFRQMSMTLIGTRKVQHGKDSVRAYELVYAALGA